MLKIIKNILKVIGFFDEYWRSDKSHQQHNFRLSFCTHKILRMFKNHTKFHNYNFITFRIIVFPLCVVINETPGITFVNHVKIL